MDREEGRLELRTTRLEAHPSSLYVDYDRELDTFLLFLGEGPQPYVGYHLDDGCYVLYDPESLEVVGFRIENWKSHFLPKHSGLDRQWAKSCGRWKRRVDPEESRLAAYQVFRGCLQTNAYPVGVHG